MCDDDNDWLDGFLTGMLIFDLPKGWIGIVLLIIIVLLLIYV